MEPISARRQPKAHRPHRRLKRIRLTKAEYACPVVSLRNAALTEPRSALAQGGFDLRPCLLDDPRRRKQIDDPRRHLTGVGDASVHVALEVQVGDPAEQLYARF